MAHIEVMIKERPSTLSVRLRSWTTWRNWQIFIAVCFLHLRYFRFSPAMLTTLPVGKHKPLLSLSPSEFTLANRWNRRISSWLQRINAPYSRCMKRALVMAMMLRGQKDLWLIIGVLPDNPKKGHAWLELGDSIVAEIFDPNETPYARVKRLHVSMRNYS